MNLQEDIIQYQKNVEDYTQALQEVRTRIAQLQVVESEYKEMSMMAARLLELTRKQLAEHNAKLVQSDMYPAEWDSEPWEKNHINPPGQKLTDNDARDIRWEYASTEKGTYALSWQYKVSSGEIHHIVTGARFASAGGPLCEKPVARKEKRQAG
jgi:DNA repair ATPase RecN